MLQSILSNKRYKLKKNQLVKSDLNSVWDFFTTTENILRLTPSKMQLAPITPVVKDSKIFQGQIIEYWLTPLLGIPLKWQTEIIDICPNQEFTDVQNSGPFGYWKHRHIFTETSVGILIEDEIDYELPITLPVVGNYINYYLVKQSLDDLFEFRKQEIDKKFKSL